MYGDLQLKWVIGIVLLILPGVGMAAKRGWNPLAAPNIEKAQEWLLQAAEDDDPVLLEEALRLGVDVNLAKPRRYNALQMAAAKGSAAVVRLLLKHPATDVNAQTVDVPKPDIDYDGYPHANSRHECPLKIALQNGHKEIAIMLLAHPDISMEPKSQRFFIDVDKRMEYAVYERFRNGDSVSWDYVQSESILSAYKGSYIDEVGGALLRKIAEPQHRKSIDAEAWRSFLEDRLSKHDLEGVRFALDMMAGEPAFDKAWELNDDRMPCPLAEVLYGLRYPKSLDSRAALRSLMGRLARLYPQAKVRCWGEAAGVSVLAKVAEIPDRVLMRDLLRAGADPTPLQGLAQWQDLLEQENYLRRIRARASVDQDTLANDVFSLVAGYMK